MNEFFHSGRVVDCILALMLIEWIVMILVRNKGLAMFKPLDAAVNIGAGAALLLALRQALRGLAWHSVALWLVVALGFHLWDLTLRGSVHRTR